MPINPDLSLLFLHIPKNAGKYIEDRYGMSCKPGNEVNQRNRSLISIISRILVKLDARNQARSAKTISGIYDVGLVCQHLTLFELQSFGFVNADISNLHILTTVRNPYSRAVSLFYHHTRKEQWNYSSFLSFVRDFPCSYSHSLRYNILAHRRPQYSFIFDMNGKVPANLFVCKTENLSSGLMKFEEASGIRALRTDHRNSMVVSNTTSHEFLTGEAKDIIYRHYSVDFHEFGYDR